MGWDVTQLVKYLPASIKTCGTSPAPHKLDVEVALVCVKLDAAVKNITTKSKLREERVYFNSQVIVSHRGMPSQKPKVAI